MSCRTEASFIGLGIALTVFGAALLWKSSDVHQTRVGAGILAAGVLLLPSVAAALASGVKQLGGAIAEAWRASKGGTS